VNGKNLARRLARLGAKLAAADEAVLRIVVTRIGEPDRIIEVRLSPREGHHRRSRVIMASERS
jgi:hypothetical protein